MFSLPARQLLFNGPPLECVFNAATSNAVDATTFTFASQKLNRPHSDRIIAVAWHSEDAATVYNLSTLTITPTGQSAISASTAIMSGASPVIKAGVWFARVPVGWDASIALTFSEAITSCGIAVYSLYGIGPYRNNALGSGGSSLTPIDLSPISSTGAVTADATAIAIQNHSPCIVIAAATNAASGDRCTWTGIDEMYDQDVSTEIGMTGGFRIYQGGGVIQPIADFVTGTSVGSAAAVFY